MLLAEVVLTSEAVGSTRARLAKVASLADLLRRLAPDEVEPAVAFLVGRPRQGKIGIGWAALRAVDPTPAEDPSIEILELDRAVTELQALEGQGSGARRLGLLGDLLARATAAEADFIRRVLIGELRQGALDGVMADAVARAAGIPPATVRRAVMLAGDLARVAAVALVEGEPGLSAIGLDVLRPVLPMLASTAADVTSALAELGPSLIEWKLDGARIQAHRKGDEVRLYTRNLNDVTDRLPVAAALLRSLDLEQVVLDGEILGVDDEGPEVFQETMRSFVRRTGPPGRASLGVWFFDCIHLDGEDLLDRPLVERAAALDRIGVPRVPSLATTADDLDTALAFETEALAAGHEGVMVKAVGSPYEAGRRGAAWRKVKPVHTLDLVVLAAEWGSGRRQGWLSNLHLGARHPDGGYVMVGKTFKGLTDALLEWQTTEFLARESGRPQPHVVEIDPPLVLEIALDGVQASTRYAGGVALRFARVRRYRDDKDPADADSIATVRAMLLRASGVVGGPMSSGGSRRLTSMTTPVDLRPAADRLARLVEGLPDDALDRPTPCQRYSVAALLDHVHGSVLAFRAAAAKNPLPGGPSGDAAHLVDDWRTRIPSDARALADDWSDPAAWEGMTAAGGVDLPGEVAAIVGLDELVIHGWDLAKATGQPAGYDGPGLDEVLHLVTEFRGGGIEGLFGPEVPVPADAPKFDRILGVSGRDPGWQPPESS